jgi:two-component system chemotaxis sensor kinase CheA
MSESDELVKEFLVESYENLDRLDRDFVALEKDPTAKETIASIFRTIHTIKGTCGFLGYQKLEGVAHVGENLLSRLRAGELVINSQITTGLLQLVDAVREILGFIESTQTEGDGDYSAVVARLRELNETEGAAPEPHPAEASVVDTIEAVDNVDAALPLAAESDVVTEGTAAWIPLEANAIPPELEEHASPPASDAKPQATPEVAPREAAGSAAGNAIRVDVRLLDKLMNLVGELVLARNQVLQHTITQTDSAFISATQRLNLITSELQESVMKTRMQPIGGLWNKFPRVVRDLSQICGKKVRIEMDGEETELDKTIIEAIKDPLTHVIRNSVDHGVETPQAREACGKPPEGCLSMRAYHESGQVIIEIKDDGKGIHPGRVKQKAVEKGLITADHAARMSDREAIALIFLPGFSTAEKITNVSGRGVGMDVVKTNIEKIGGMVDVQSVPGKGTTLRIKIPLTLAIIPALVVTSRGEQFVIPQVNLLELIRLDEKDEKIRHIRDTSVYRLRGKLLPIVYLNRLMGTQAVESGESKPARAEIMVVLRAGESQFGLVVDQVNDTEEIVVKPLGKQLKEINVFAGATIMGDGRVALILDVMGLAQRANILSQGGNPVTAPAAEAAKTASLDREAVLLFEVRNHRRMAIPLSLISRLEEFSPQAIERAGNRTVVQYRGEIIPLIDLAKTLSNPSPGRTSRHHAGKHPRGKTAPDPDRKVQVVVFTHEHRTIGLLVDQIVDVAQESFGVQGRLVRPGVQGTAVIKDQVTEIINLDAVVRLSQEHSPSLAA